MKLLKTFNNFSKKGMTWQKITSYTIAIIVFLTILLIIGPRIPGVGNIASDLAEDTISNLEESKPSAQESVNLQVNMQLELEKEIAELANTISKYQSEKACLIPITTTFTTLSEDFEEVLSDNTIIFESKNNELAITIIKDSTGSQNAKSFPIKGISQVNLIRDAAPLAKENDFEPILEIIESKITDIDPPGYYKTKITTSGRRGQTINYDLDNEKESLSANSVVIFPIIEKGRFSKDLGPEKSLLKEYIIQFQDRIFFYSGERKGWNSDVKIKDINFEKHLCEE